MSRRTRPGSDDRVDDRERNADPAGQQAEGIRSGAHLPHLRPGQEPPPPSWLPRQRHGVSPQMIGRYPDFDVLDNVEHWDETTKKTVLARLEPPGSLRFFSAEEEPTLRTFCDVVLAQDSEPRVPVAESVDDKMASGRLDGYRYVDMPDDRDTWRIVLRGLEHSARADHGAPGFADGSGDVQHAVVGAFAKARLSGGPWDELNVSRAWTVVMRAVLSGFYSHPWAWNEIGFGGPAYPRGFMRRDPLGPREPFETPGAVDADPTRGTE